MKKINVKITFEDQFSFAKDIKTTTTSETVFSKMKNDIGKLVPVFNKEQQIMFTMKIINVEQI